jgi:hypothetical protein
MMFNHRLARTAAIAIAIAATAAPTAFADDHWRPQDATPQDLRSPDARDAAEPRGLYEPMRPQDQPQPPQDLRNPDTRDFADGRGTYNAPEVVVVKAAPPAEPTATGIDWEDVGIGAGGLLAASLIALGGTLLVVQRRGARAQAVH